MIMWEIIFFKIYFGVNIVYILLTIYLHGDRPVSCVYYVFSISIVGNLQSMNNNTFTFKT